MNKILSKRQSGVLCHISSLHTNFGIGDLGQAAFNFVDYLVLAKQSIWQILPINPTSFGDSPYSCFSSFAGNHLFICPQLLVEWDLLSPSDILHDVNFPEGQIDYAIVSSLKEKIFRKAFLNFKNSERIHSGYVNFVEKNDYWLADYSLFMSLKSYFIEKRKNDPVAPRDENVDYYYGAVWQIWDKELTSRQAIALDKYTKLLSDEIDYHNFLQFIFYKQYNALRTYAAKNNVLIAGDIPIFVAYDSADCWANQELFQLAKDGTPTAVAGVPPDYFAVDGQLWGNPLYDWNASKKTGYAWWIARIRAAMEVFDLIRLDHFRGFYSFWAVPYGEKTAKSGKWQKGPSDDLFAAVRESLGDLPIIAEDLGIITPQVRILLEKLGFPAMRVLQFAFDQNPKNTHLPHNFQTSNLVVYTGTHDNDTTCGWYSQASEASRDQFRRYLNASGDSPAWSLIRATMLSVASIAITPIQDILELDSRHRTNTPGTASGNWIFALKKDQLTAEQAEKLAYLTTLSSRTL